ncbi:MAG: hypothetical protein LBB41_00720, partial [Prevotellaceae bacterium]|nr:hypothetical protein [Prevotellaceae bacterium]
VSTGAARYQDISLNPQKLAGQCGKLKCCMNYELDIYIEALKDFPSREIPLETLDNTYFHFKSDVFKRLMTYSTDRNNAVNLVTMPVERVKEVVAMNKNGEKPLKLLPDANEVKAQPSDYENVVGQDSLTRFDRSRNHRHKPKLVKKSENGDESFVETPANKSVSRENSRPQQRNFRANSSDDGGRNRNFRKNNNFKPRNNSNENT